VRNKIGRQFYVYISLPSYYSVLSNDNISFSVLLCPLKNACHLYGRTIAGYYENVHELQTWKLEQNTKKTSGIPFTLEKLRETADVIKR
jgi:hypothetical protein